MRQTGEELGRRVPEGAPGTDRRRRRVVAAMAVSVALLVAMSAVALAMRTPTDGGLAGAPPAPAVPGPMGEGEVPAPGPIPPSDPPGPGEPGPGPIPPSDPPGPGEPAPVPDPEPAPPARIEVRDERLYLLGVDGQVLRTLRDAHDGSQEYTLRNVAVRPGSTSSDLAVAFVEGYMTGTLRVLVVRDGGDPEVVELTTVDYELHDQQPMALPAGVWSPDGTILAWLEPDPANRALLRAVRWTVAGRDGEATPAGGIPVDPDGLMGADQTRGLELVGWESAPVEQLRTRAYLPYEGGAERHYTIRLVRDGEQLDAQPLVRS